MKCSPSKPNEIALFLLTTCSPFLAILQDLPNIFFFFFFLILLLFLIVFRHYFYGSRGGLPWTAG